MSQEIEITLKPNRHYRGKKKQVDVIKTYTRYILMHVLNCFDNILFSQGLHVPLYTGPGPQSIRQLVKVTFFIIRVHGAIAVRSSFARL